MTYIIKGSKTTKVPAILKNTKFKTYEQARNALRAYIRTKFNNGARHISAAMLGFSIRST